MKIAILMTTYERKDGKSPEFLKKSLLSIKNQIYQDYVLYLIGDKYDNDEELKLLSKIIDENKIKCINLPNAVEREKYIMNSVELWASGGVNALNFGIDKVLSDGLSYICHLDHDDYWENNHLLEINNIIENNKKYVVIVTNSTHPLIPIIPRITNNGYYPIANDVIHSSICIDFSIIPMRYRDVYSITGNWVAADADMWNRISEYMKSNGLRGYHINKITCHHTDHHNDKI